MSATTADRNTLSQYIQRQLSGPLTVATKIPSGVMVMVIIGTGTLLNAADTAGGKVVGLSTQPVDTLLGDTVCVYEKGAFWMANDGTITQADVGGNCTVLDNQTVSKAATTANDIVAGEIEMVDARGVLVAIL